MQYYNMKFLRLKLKKLLQVSNQIHNVNGIRLQAKIDYWIDQNIDSLYLEMSDMTKNVLNIERR